MCVVCVCVCVYVCTQVWCIISLKPPLFCGCEPGKPPLRSGIHSTFHHFSIVLHFSPRDARIEHLSHKFLSKETSPSTSQVWLPQDYAAPISIIHSADHKKCLYTQRQQSQPLICKHGWAHNSKSIMGCCICRFSQHCMTWGMGQGWEVEHSQIWQINKYTPTYLGTCTTQWSHTKWCSVSQPTWQWINHASAPGACTHHDTCCTPQVISSHHVWTSPSPTD